MFKIRQTNFQIEIFELEKTYVNQLDYLCS